MDLRSILSGYLAAVSFLVPGSPARAQEPPEKRLSAIVGVAVEEYGKGVDPKGHITSAVELDEATGFLRDARDVAQRLTSANAAAVRLILDSLTAAAARRARPSELATLHEKFVLALGEAGALDLPTHTVNLERGRELFTRNCEQCHGPSGAGDGPLARSITPPPEAIGSRTTMRTRSPALMYRIVSVGVEGTMMPAWAQKLTPDERWAVVGYVNALRATDAERAAGATILGARCPTCGGAHPPAMRTFTWQAERTDEQIASAIAAGDSSTAMRDGSRLSPAEIGDVVAALRASPLVVPGAAATAGGRTTAAEPLASDPRTAARNVLRHLDDALTAARAGRTSDAGDLAFDAYIAFEPLEGPARMRNPGVVATMERRFADFKGALKDGDIASAEAQRSQIEQGMPTILELSTPTSTWWGVFLESFLILVREGFEAMLVIGAVVAFLIKTGNRERLRDIWWGSLAGIGASAVLAVLLRTILSAVPASQDIIEGATMLVAVVVLFSVSYWLLSKVESAKWQRFIREKVNAALSHGGSFALSFVAFLAVFREGAETALFYQALFTRAQDVVAPVSAGVAAAAVALVVIFSLFYRFGVKIPLRPFFAVTGALLYFMAFVFAGKGIKELQEGNAIGQTLIPGFPHVEAIGLYPTVETLLAQGVLVALLLFALWRTLTPALVDEGAEAAAVDIPPEVAARLAELQAAAQRLQDRVNTLEREIEHEGTPRGGPSTPR